MCELPSGWKRGLLSEFAQIGSGDPITKSRLGGPFPLMGANGPIGAARDYNFEDGYLVGRVGAAGAVTDVSGKCWASDNTLTVKPKPAVIDRRYLGYLLRKLNLAELATRSAQPLVTQTQLAGRNCMVPAKKPEQAIVAQILDTLDTQIRQTEALIAKLERIKQGLLTDLLTRGIDENGQLRPTPDQAPHLYKESPLGRIPREWYVMAFLEVASLPSGQVSPLAPEYRDMPLVAPDHIESGTAKLIKVETAREQGAISGKYLFVPGDVVYSKIRPYLRKMWLANLNGLCSADMYPLRPRPGISSMFLLMVVMGERFSEFANAVSMRTGIPKINRHELASVELAVPPATEQMAIEEALSSVNRRIESERENLKKLGDQKQGLMDDLLTGRVRVTPLLESAKQAHG